MDKFNWMFDKDRFTLYKTWKHDNSVVYRLTTWTNVTAYISSWVLPVKTNVIFLKVQKPTFPSAYDALKRAGVELDPDARTGIDDTVLAMGVQKIAFWQTTSGSSIMDFCRKHAANIETGTLEHGYLRIFTIVWAPGGEKVRRDDMQSFIGDHFRLQMTHAKIGVERKAMEGIVWVTKKLLQADLDVDADADA